MRDYIIWAIIDFNDCFENVWEVGILDDLWSNDSSPNPLFSIYF